MGLYTIYFSPTGNTKKSVNAMAAAVGTGAFTEIDCTCQGKYTEKFFSQEDFVIFGAPVYGGRIPQAAMVRLNTFKGEQTPCIITVSYGNRHYDDALLELKDMAERNGFVVKGGAAVIGRHTFGEIQTDRPNAEDLREMADFACRAYRKIGSTGCIPGNPVYKEGGKGGNFRPSTMENCVKCGLCKRDCPVSAIDDDFQVIEEKCISCFRCIRNCPVKAKVMNTESYQQFAADFTQRLSQRRENEFYIE